MLGNALKWIGIFGVLTYNILCSVISKNEVYIMEFMTIKEAAEKWHISVRRVQTICNEGNVEGAVKFGGVWAIPKDAEKPADRRVKTGKYNKS